MKNIAIASLLLVPGAAYAGSLGTLMPWISKATPQADLVLNNDDYRGSFNGNYNAFRVNETAAVAQSIVSTERIIPTVDSGGITEYALTMGGSYSDSDARPGVNLDSLFRVQLGFGTGDNFTRASDVTAELRFDMPGDVSPTIEDFYASKGEIPILKLLEHRGDTLIYQGSSTSGYFSQYNFYNDGVFYLPLDIPDLPLTVRDLYTASALEGLGATETAFTIRVGPVLIDGDFNANGALDEPDVNLLTSVIVSGSHDAPYDLTGDNLVNQGDLINWVKDRKHTWFGDANLDGEFNSGDLVSVLAAGEYEDELTGNSGWSEGDWDGDAEFTTSDLVYALADGGYEQGPRQAVTAVPEPNSLMLLGLSIACFSVCPRRLILAD